MKNSHVQTSEIFVPRVCLQSHLLDPIMVKYEHDVITPESDVIAPDSQMHHVTSTAPSPYADFAAEV